MAIIGNGGGSASNEQWGITSYGSFPVPYNQETDQYGVVGGQESAQILSDMGINNFQAFETNGGQNGGLWDTVGDVWTGAQEFLAGMGGNENGETETQESQQPMVLLGGNGGIDQQQLMTWAVIGGVAYLIYQNS